MKKAVFIVVSLFPILLFAQDEVIHLSGQDDLPTLTVFRPAKDKSNGTAVIVCAGGAYAFRSDDGEGISPCKMFRDSGITAFLLDYRLPKGNDTIPLHDAHSAIKYIRAHYMVFNIDTNKVGILGFSAGGHLASTAGTHYRDARERPDFMVLVYAVVSMADSLTHERTRSELMGNAITPEKIKLYSNELQVTDSTPSTFLVHAMDDPGVPVANSLYFEAALLQHHVLVQLWLYLNGGHAFDIHNATAKVQWTDDCIWWIKKMKWKKDNEK